MKKLISLILCVLTVFMLVGCGNEEPQQETYLKFGKKYIYEYEENDEHDEYYEKNTLIFSVISCQFISNVPSAILLSQFTNNYQDLLVGVNIGGAGTLIASLASLITFREYVKHNPGKTKYYTGMFSLFNFSFLGILTVIMLFV